MRERLIHLGAAGTVLLATATPLPAADAPRPRAGWKLELVAEAPRIAAPTVIAPAPDGRILVAEDPMDISTSADQQLGRILCFHPSGEVTVYAEKLHAVFGMRYLEGQLYVLHNPKFTVFTDGGGSGTRLADLIENTNPNPWALDWNDHVPANFELAMDGYLYVSIGDKGLYNCVGRDGKRVDLHGGGVLRMRPDATALEVFTTGTRNHLDIAMNAEDEFFTYDNTDEKDGWWTRVTHMIDGGYYGYPYEWKPREPHTLWAMGDYGGGAPVTAYAYEEDALPAEYHGNLFLSDFGRRELLRLKVERDGATYRIASTEQLLSEQPGDFRPVGIAFAADAMTLYIADWNHADFKEDVRVGRLWKLSFTGAPSAAAPKPDWYLPAAMGKPVQAPAADLLAGLRHPARSVRLLAQRRIAERGSSAAASLTALLKDPQAPPRARWHALWALDAIDGGAAARRDIIGLLANAERTVRLQAARQLGERRAPEAGAALERLLAGEDPALRLRAATALGRIAEPSAVPALLGSLAETDLFARFAAFTALRRIGRAHPDAWNEVAKGLKSDDPRVREGTLFALREEYDERVVAELAAAAGDRGRPGEARAEILRVLAGVHRKRPEWKGEWWAYFPYSSPRAKKDVAWEGTAAVIAALRAGIDDEDRAVRLAAAEGAAEVEDRDSAARIRELFAKEKAPGDRARLLRTLGKLGDREAVPLAAGVLRDEGAGQDLLFAAAAAAEDLSASDLLREALRARRGGREVVLSVMAALGRLRDPQAAAELAAVVEGDDLELRKAAVAALAGLACREAVPALNRAFLDAELRFEAASALAQFPDLRALDAYLFGLEEKNASLRDACRNAVKAIREQAFPALESRAQAGLLSPRAAGAVRPVFEGLASAQGSALLAMKIEKPDPERYLAHALEKPGDPARGQAIFNDLKGAGCARCHGSGGKEGAVGPDLAGVGTRLDRRQLAESVLYPSKAVREGYQQHVVLLKDGRVITGLPRGETEAEVHFLDAEAREHRIAKDEIEHREASELSIMPEGLNAGLSLDEFADLMAFLAAWKGPPAGAAAPGAVPSRGKGDAPAGR